MRSLAYSSARLRRRVNADSLALGRIWSGYPTCAGPVVRAGQEHIFYPMRTTMRAIPKAGLCNPEIGRAGSAANVHTFFVLVTGAANRRSSMRYV